MPAMKCEIKSWALDEVECDTNPLGDCANCGLAWGYMSLFGPGAFSHQLSKYDTSREGKELVARVKFNDGDPIDYTCRIKGGKYIHLEKE